MTGITTNPEFRTQVARPRAACAERGPQPRDSAAETFLTQRIRPVADVMRISDRTPRAPTSTTPPSSDSSASSRTAPTGCTPPLTPRHPCCYPCRSRPASLPPPAGHLLGRHPHRQQRQPRHRTDRNRRVRR
jgi:hypothetical protein